MPHLCADFLAVTKILSTCPHVLYIVVKEADPMKSIYTVPKKSIYTANDLFSIYPLGLFFSIGLLNRSVGLKLWGHWRFITGCVTNALSVFLEVFSQGL